MYINHGAFSFVVTDGNRAELENNFKILGISYDPDVISKAKDGTQLFIYDSRVEVDISFSKCVAEPILDSEIAKLAKRAQAVVKAWANGERVEGRHADTDWRVWPYPHSINIHYFDEWRVAPKELRLERYEARFYDKETDNVFCLTYMSEADMKRRIKDQVEQGRVVISHGKVVYPPIVVEE